MHGLLAGLLGDPAESQEFLVEIVHKHAQNAPELLPALRDVISSGILYEKKLKTFLDLFGRECERQRHLLTGECLETQRLASRTASENRAVVKERKKRKATAAQNSHSSTTVGHMASDADKIALATFIPQPSNDDYEFSTPTEDTPIVKKKKKLKKTGAPNSYSTIALDHRDSGTPTVQHGSTGTEDESTAGDSTVDQNVYVNPGSKDENHIYQPSTSIGHVPVIKSMKKGKNFTNQMERAADDRRSVTPSRPRTPATSPMTDLSASIGTTEAQNHGMVQAKEEFKTDVKNMDENILINVVVDDCNSQALISTQSNAEQTPKKCRASTSTSDVELTPFRVIPSVQLMEDPTRFPDLLPPATGSQVSGSADAVRMGTPKINEYQSSSVNQITPPEAGDGFSVFSGNESKTAGLDGLDLSGMTSSIGSLDDVPRSSDGILLELSDLERLLDKCQITTGKQTCQILKEWMAVQKRLLLSDMGDNKDAVRKTSLQWINDFKEWSSRRNYPPRASGDENSASYGESQKSMDSDNSVPRGHNNSQLSGSRESLNVEPLVGPDHVVPGSSSEKGIIPMEYTEHSTECNEDERRSSKRDVIKRLLEPSTVGWAMRRCCQVAGGSRKHFREWLDVQKKGLPSDSVDNGNILFRPPKQWINDFEQWLNRRNHTQMHGYGCRPSVDRAMVSGTSNDNFHPGRDRSRQDGTRERLNDASLAGTKSGAPRILNLHSMGGSPSNNVQPRPSNSLQDQSNEILNDAGPDSNPLRHLRAGRRPSHDGGPRPLMDEKPRIPVRPGSRTHQDRFRKDNRPGSRTDRPHGGTRGSSTPATGDTCVWKRGNRQEMRNRRDGRSTGRRGNRP